MKFVATFKTNEGIDKTFEIGENIGLDDAYRVVANNHLTTQNIEINPNMDYARKIHLGGDMSKHLAPNGKPSNLNHDSENPNIRFDKGGEIENLIYQGEIELKVYPTTPKHANLYGLKSENPLYIQSIFISENQRLKGIGKKVLKYLNDFAIENGHDVMFGHITQKASFSKDDSRESNLDDVAMIKNWLQSNGYEICEGNNDFYKVVNNPDIRFDKGGELDETAQMYIDIISMNPNLEKYQKYKKILKEEYNIDFDSIYKDQEYIETANLQDIKSQDDFLDFDNWITYAKKISKMRGFVRMDDYMMAFKYDVTDDVWKKISALLDFDIEKVEYIETTKNGDIARVMGNTLYYTEHADLYYLLHEIGHIYDFQNNVNGIIHNPAYSPTNYGTMNGGETFAENFAIYFINPKALKNWNAEVYYQMQKTINPKYQVELSNLVSDYLSDGGNSNIRFELGGRTIAQTPAPKKDRVYGSKTNPKGSAKDKTEAKAIKFSPILLKSIKNKIDAHNSKYPTKKVNLATAKAVVRRGMGAYSKTHRPTISGGAPNSRQAWGIARLNKFLLKKAGYRVKRAYVQDDDLL